MTTQVHQSMQLTNQLPDGFVDLHDVDPSIKIDMFYHGEQNFMGCRAEGYGANRCITTRPVAEALRNIQAELKSKGLAIKVYDAYRPQDAVDHFERWSKDVNDQKMKKMFYPEVDKSKMFEMGYIAKRSVHTRGAAVDLNLIYINPPHPVQPRPADWIGYWDEQDVALDMGVGVDGFDDRAHHGNTSITPEQQANRDILVDVMTRHGFTPYRLEFWHYNFKDELFPETYFNFHVK